MGKMIRKQSVAPVTLDGKGTEHSSTLHSLQTYMEESLANQASTERTIKQNTKQIAKITESVEEVKQQFKEATKSHVAKRIIREQL
ncbi:hypothetical protein [Bacillus cereus]|nr:hypothetical protein [Bacillus cereus]